MTIIGWIYGSLGAYLKEIARIVCQQQCSEEEFTDRYRGGLLRHYNLVAEKIQARKANENEGKDKARLLGETILNFSLQGFLPNPLPPNHPGPDFTKRVD